MKHRTFDFRVWQSTRPQVNSLELRFVLGHQLVLGSGLGLRVRARFRLALQTS